MGAGDDGAGAFPLDDSTPMTGEGVSLGAFGAGDDGGSDKFCPGVTEEGSWLEVGLISMYVELSTSVGVLEPGLISTYRSSMYKPSSSK